MTSIPFNPSDTSSPPFQTTVTLDGNSYGLSTVWNIAGQRWYFQLVASATGQIVLFAPLVGSYSSAIVNLIYGYFFTSTMYYDAGTGSFVVMP